jgi:hypothetical protein
MNCTKTGLLAVAVRLRLLKLLPLFNLLSPLVSVAGPAAILFVISPLIPRTSPAPQRCKSPDFSGRVRF